MEGVVVLGDDGCGGCLVVVDDQALKSVTVIVDSGGGFGWCGVDDGDEGGGHQGGENSGDLHIRQMTLAIRAGGRRCG